MGMFYTKEQIFSMFATWENISINNCQVKMQVDTSADITVILSKIWTELGKPQLHGKIRHLKAYDGHQLPLAVLQSDNKFGLLGRDLLLKHGVKKIKTERLSAGKGYKAHVKLIPGSLPMFSKAGKISLPLQDKVTEKVEQMVRQDILEAVQPGGTAKRYMHNQHISGTVQDVPTTSGIENSSSFFHNCIESTLRGIKGCVESFKTMCWSMEQPKISSTRECLQSRVNCVRKFFTITENKSNSKPFDSVIFLGYSISKKGIAPDPKNVEKNKKNAKSTN